MEEEKKLSEKESLDLITSMITKAKESFHDTGWGPIMWGTVIVFCSLFTWAKVHFGFSFPFNVWWLTVVAIVPQVLISTRENRNRGARSYNDIAMDYIWIGFGICMFLLSFTNGAIQADMNKTFSVQGTGFSEPGQFMFNYSSALFMILYGLPTFATGGIMRFRPMLLGGIICWVCAVVSLFTPAKTDLLLMAAAALFAWLIPGILINRKCVQKRRQHV